MAAVQRQDQEYTAFQAARIAVNSTVIECILYKSMYMSQCQIINVLILQFIQADAFRLFLASVIADLTVQCHNIEIIMV